MVERLLSSAPLVILLASGLAWASPGLSERAAAEVRDLETDLDEAEDEAEGDIAEGRESASQKELEELQRTEEAVVKDEPLDRRDLLRMGINNPMRQRAEDATRSGTTPVDTGTAEDAGTVLAELGGIDLATLEAEYDIPIVINDDVLQYIRFFQGSGRKWYARWLARSHRWIPFERTILAEEGVPLDLVYLSMIESGYSAYAYSWARASGLWQFISSTGKMYGLRDDFWVDERRDPAKATRSAARYLRDLYREFGDWYLAWAAYNAGSAKLRKAISMYKSRDFFTLAHAGSYLRKETKHYVPKLIAAAIIAKHPERFGFTDIEPEGRLDYEEVEIADAMEIDLLARLSGASVEELQALNPALRRWCTPPARNGKGYVIKVPKGTGETLLASLDGLPAEQRRTFRHMRVGPGDTLASIAKRFDMSVDELMRLNAIPSVKKLKARTDLIVPVSQEVALAMRDTGAEWKEERVAHRRGARGTSSAAARLPAARRAQAAAPPGRYVVRDGDTLWSISRRFGVGVDDLKRWNGLRRGNRALEIGRALVVSPPKAKPGRGGRARG